MKIRNTAEKAVYYFISEMKIYEFSKIIDRFEVALFFACCKYYKEKNQYRPLDKSDFKEEKDEYGVIFKADAFLADLRYGASECKSGIMPIGFQPFMRCHRQYGYAYVMEENGDPYKSDDFYIMKFFNTWKVGKEYFQIKISRQRVHKIDPNYKKSGFSKECMLPIRTRTVYIPEGGDKFYLSMNYKTVKKDEGEDE